MKHTEWEALSNFSKQNREAQRNLFAMKIALGIITGVTMFWAFAKRLVKNHACSVNASQGFETTVVEQADTACDKAVPSKGHSIPAQKVETILLPSVNLAKPRLGEHLEHAKNMQQ